MTDLSLALTLPHGKPGPDPGWSWLVQTHHGRAWLILALTTDQGGGTWPWLAQTGFRWAQLAMPLA